MDLMCHFFTGKGLVRTYLCFIYLYNLLIANVWSDIINGDLRVLTVRCLRTHFWWVLFRIKIAYSVSAVSSCDMLAMAHLESM